MALINAIGAVALIEGDGRTDGSEKEKPMEITYYCVEYVFPRKGVGIFFLEERKIVLLRIVGHFLVEETY